MSFNKSITEFKNDVLIPKMYEHIDILFPEMEFVRRGAKWESPLFLDGTLAGRKRNNRCVITAKKPHLVLENSQAHEAVPIVDYYGRWHGFNTKAGGSEFILACRDICSKIGEPFPELDAESEARVQRYTKSQERLRTASKLMEDALAKKNLTSLDVYNYLTMTRGYDDGFIKYAHLGFVTREAADILREKDVLDVVPSGLGSRYVLAIPNRSSRVIRSFTFRMIQSEEGAAVKYKCASAVEHSAKSCVLFGADSLVADRDRKIDVVIVEGELDALMASYRGIPNVVALCGNSLSDEAVADLKLRGVGSVTILLDREESGQENSAKVISNGEAAIAKGLRVYVARFGYDGGKMDADLFLRGNDGVDERIREFRRIIADAVPLYQYQYEIICRKYQSLHENSDEELTEKEFDAWKYDTMELRNRATLSPTERGWVSRQFVAQTGGYVSLEDFNTEADMIAGSSGKVEQEEALKKVIQKADRTLKEEGTAETLALLRDGIESVSAMAGSSRFENFFEPVGFGEYLDEILNKPEGIPTDYFMFGMNGAMRLTIPSGALTYICGQTSHGKTRMMENLALSVAKNKTLDGDVLYISFEESKGDIMLQLLNIYQQQVLSRTSKVNGIDVLKGYLRAPCHGSVFDPRTDTDLLDRRISEFRAMIETGRLRPMGAADKDGRRLDCESLCEVIRLANSKRTLLAVFVDYAQLIYTTSTHGTRKDELAKITQELMSLSVSLQLPIVLGAQLNREAQGPTEIDIKQIADASNLEHSANMVLMLWNSSAKISPNSSYYTDGKNKILSADGERLREMGFRAADIKTGESELYAVLAKNRGGSRYEEAVFKFIGSTGEIKPNEPERDQLGEYRLPSWLEKTSTERTQTDQVPGGKIGRAPLRGHGSKK